MSTKNKKKGAYSKIPQKSIFAKRIWLLEKLLNNDYTSEELRNFWFKENEEEVCDKTISRWADGAETDFEVDIDRPNKSNGKKYSLSRDSKGVILKNGSKKWIIASSLISDTIQKYQKTINDKILMDDIPSAGKYLDEILEAISYKEEIKITYKKYSGNGTPEEYIFHPYCVKLFENRWYVTGFCPKKKKVDDDGLRTFSLDQIQELTVNEDNKCDPIKFNEVFDAKAYFDKYFGIYTGVKDKTRLEIKIKVFGDRVRYFRELPLHHTQKEINSVTGEDSYSIYQYDLIPAEDFYQALLHHGGHIEVLSPESVRNKMKEKIQEMAEKYKLT